MKFAKLEKVDQILKSTPKAVVRVQRLKVVDYGAFVFKDGSSYDLRVDHIGQTIELKTNLANGEQEFRLL